MNKIITTIALSLMLFSTTSCYVRVNDKFGNLINTNSVSVKPSGETATQNYTFDKINSILVNNGSIEYVQGDSQKPYVIIEADRNYMDHIEVTNEDGSLSVKTNIRSLKSSDEIKIMVYSAGLESLAIAGAAKFSSHSINTDADLFGVSISGAGELSIDSLCGSDMNFDIAGAAAISFDSVKANDVRFTVSGAGEADVNFHKANKVITTFSGAADISLSGECNYVEVSGSGAGDIDISKLKYNDSKIDKSMSVSVKE